MYRLNAYIRKKNVGAVRMEVFEEVYEFSYLPPPNKSITVLEVTENCILVCYIGCAS